MKKEKISWGKNIIEAFIPNRYNILLTLIFIFTAILSLFGVKPFAYYTTIGNRVTAKPSILVIGPIYPLIWILEKIGIKIDFGSKSAIPILVLVLIILLIYYYILSCLLVFIFKQLQSTK